MNDLPVALQNLATLDLKTGAASLFAALGYASEKTEELPSPDAAGFAGAFHHDFSKTALEDEWKRVELLFQLTNDELNGQMSLQDDGFNAQRFESFLFFALELEGEKYSRSALAGIARELNKPFPAPVIVLFRHGQTVSLASLHRRENKNDSNRDVLDRVVLLKDIRLENPHRAHLDILRDLAGAKSRARDWKSFLAEWNRVLDLSELNKKFYRELSNWFFAAREHAQFPDKTENAAERGLIRLITRIIFTWFVKERGLVPDALFQKESIAALLKDVSPDSATYYRAVLQNLFFATLNTEMGERRFRKAEGGAHGQAGDYGLSCFFRYEQEFKAPEKWLELVQDVPFLNGGLFECLDPEDKDGARIDGFSDVASRQAHLPNFLFWGDDFSADLSGVYDDKKQKAVRVKPLLNLLHAYKFTVDENTPLEEDVALDPELQSKVFENLLASYNPETRTTARKQTGSFYTPREIVGYMVDEALFAYLIPTLDALNVPDAPVTLRALLADADPRDAQALGLDDAMITALIERIETLKLLDPAIGSGAFPMGALQKLVWLLKKLDPNNEKWKAVQLKAARTIQDAGARATAIAAVEDTFEHNAADYGRKLYLIEKCIYGVDIQPIALQIAKLRFFISLIIDQTIDDTRPNRNIRALPNLETKFVCANTLVGLPRQSAMTPHELPALQSELEDVRRRHIAPRNRHEKKQLEKEDGELRAKIRACLTEAGFDGTYASLIADWNPYDQNATASFFDPLWMFGPDEAAGFDIVLANPPYVDIKGLPNDIVKMLFANYKTAKNRVNLYAAFLEKGLKLTKEEGILAYIHPNSLLVNESYSEARRLLLPHLKKLIKLPDDTFESATVETMLTFAQRTTTHSNSDNDIVLGKTFGHHEKVDFHVIKFDSFSKRSWSAEPQARYSIFATDKSSTICDKIRKGRDLIEFVEFTLGITPYDKYKGHSEETITTRAYHSATKKSKDYVPLISGANILRYVVTDTVNEYLRYGPWLGAPREERFFTSPRIIVRQIASGNPPRIYAGYTEKTLYHTQIGFSLLNRKKSKRELLFILALLNSTLLNFYHRETFLDKEKVTFQKVLIANCKKLPIPNATPAEQQSIAAKVELILAAKAAAAGADVSTLEREIDELVAALYGLDDAEKKLVGIG